MPRSGRKYGRRPRYTINRRKVLVAMRVIDEETGEEIEILRYMPAKRKKKASQKGQGKKAKVSSGSSDPSEAADTQADSRDPEDETRTIMDPISSMAEATEALHDT